MSQLKSLPHSCHWGAFSVSARDGEIEVVPHADDPDPSALLANIPAAVAHKARIARPMIRRGWLEAGAGAGPPAVRSFKLSNDPKFADKLKAVVGLYRSAGACGGAQH